MSAERPEGGCPACGARFRGAALCSRCGADLTRLMSLAAAGFLERREARRLLLQGDLDAAIERARRAQRLAATSAGAAVLKVATCLALVSRREEGPRLTAPVVESPPSGDGAIY